MRVVGRQKINILNVKLGNGKFDKGKIKLGQGTEGQKLFQVERSTEPSLRRQDLSRDLNRVRRKQVEGPRGRGPLM